MFEVKEAPNCFLCNCLLLAREEGQDSIPPARNRAISGTSVNGEMHGLCTRLCWAILRDTLLSEGGHAERGRGLLAYPCRAGWHVLSLTNSRLLYSVCCRDKAPGQRECDYSIDGINRSIRDIEQASLAAVSQSLATRDDISVEVG